MSAACPDRADSLDSRSLRICDSPEWLLALIARGGDGFVEIRYGRSGFPRRHFLPAERVAREPETVIAWTLELTELYDVVVGMTVRRSKRGDSADCVRANLLWADIDGEHDKLTGPHSRIDASSPVQEVADGRAAVTWVVILIVRQGRAVGVVADGALELGGIGRRGDVALAVRGQVFKLAADRTARG